MDLILTNDLDRSLGCGSNVPLIDLVLNLILFTGSITYFFNLGSHPNEFIVYEFSIILLYVIVYYGIVLICVIYLLYKLFISGYEKVLETKAIVEERQKNYSTFS